VTAVCNVPSFLSDSRTGYSLTHSAKQHNVGQTSFTTINVATESSLSCIKFLCFSFLGHFVHTVEEKNQSTSLG